MIHIVDDDRSVRTALARLLHNTGFDTRSYASAAEFLVADRDDTPSCILLDVGLPGMTGVELQAALAKKEGGLPIVFLTGRGDIDMGVRAMKAGAVDFLTKPVKRNVLLAAVNAALARDSQQHARQALRAIAESLTPRERGILELIAEGQSNKEIARALGIAPETVKSHVKNIFDKLSVEKRAQAIARAQSLGLLKTV